MGGEKRGQEKKWGLGETKGLTVVRTHIIGCVSTSLCMVLSIPAEHVTISTWLIRTNIQKNICAWHTTTTHGTGQRTMFLGRSS